MIDTSTARAGAAALVTLVLGTLACGGGGGEKRSDEVPVTLGGAGPGDAARHLPLDLGNQWVFHSTGSDHPTYGAVTVVTVASQIAVGGVPAVVVREESSGEPDVRESRIALDASGLANLGSGDPSDPLGSFWELRYPLEPGTSFVQLDRKGISYGSDLDGDGRDETVDVESVATVVATEAVTVPVGTFPGCLRVEWKQTLDVALSRNGQHLRGTTLATAWLAPGVGWVKRTEAFSSAGVTATREERLLAYSVAGRSGRIELRATPSTLAYGFGSWGTRTPLQVVGIGEGGEHASLPAVWSSSDSSVARLDAAPTGAGVGSPTAWVTVGDAGTATVTATVGPLASNPVTITVSGSGQPVGPVRIALSPSSAAVRIGGTTTFSANAYGASGYWTPVASYGWTSSDPAVATVDGTGNVTGVGPGTATITAAAGGVASPPVTVTVSGLRSLALPTNDLVYDATRERIYASVPSRHGLDGNSVAVIDPWTRAVVSYVWVGSEPGKLALSGDARFLYVGLDGAGAVARLDLQRAGGPAVDLAFPLGSADLYGQRYAEDLAVMPGSPETVAIALRYGSVSPRHAGVAVFDGGVQRPGVTPGHTGSNAIEFSADGSMLYGLNIETSEFGFRRMAVDASGVSVLTVDAFAPSGYGADMAFGEGRIFTTTGAVYDPEARALLGTFTGFSWATVLEAAPAGRRVLFLSGDVSFSGAWALKAYDRTTFVPLGSEVLPGISMSSGAPRDLVRWGTQGVAFRTVPDYGGTSGDEVYFLESPVAGP